MPFRKLAQIGDYPLGVRPEVMRPVGMQQDSRLIVVVMRVACDVSASVYDQARGTALAGQPFREDCTGVTCADDEVVPSYWRQGVKWAGMERSSLRGLPIDCRAG